MGSAFAARVHFPLAPFPVAAGSAIFGNKALEGPLAFLGCRVKRTPCIETAVYNTNKGEEAGTISTKNEGKKIKTQAHKEDLISSLKSPNLGHSITVAWFLFSAGIN